MGAHLFVVYYSTFAFITPPVGPALYSSMAIANVSLAKIGKEAVRIALPTFLIPFMFVYSPSLLLLTDFSLQSILMILASAVSVVVLVIGLEGYLFSRLSWPVRLLFCAASVLLIIPHNLVGIMTILFLAVFVILIYKAEFITK